MLRFISGKIIAAGCRINCGLVFNKKVDRIAKIRVVNRRVFASDNTVGCVIIGIRFHNKRELSATLALASSEAAKLWFGVCLVFKIRGCMLSEFLWTIVKSFKE